MHAKIKLPVLATVGFVTVVLLFSAIPQLSILWHFVSHYFVISLFRYFVRQANICIYN